MWWLLVHGKAFRVDDTTYFGLASTRIASGGAAAGSPVPGEADGSSAAAIELEVARRKQGRILKRIEVRDGQRALTQHDQA